MRLHSFPLMGSFSVTISVIFPSAGETITLGSFGMRRSGSRKNQVTNKNPSPKIAVAQ